MMSDDNSSIICEGYLLKESKHLKIKRKRWMVLKGNSLYSYQKKQTYSNPTEIFNLFEYDKIESESNISFHLMSGKKQQNRTFFAMSDHDVQFWIHNISRIQKKATWDCWECTFVNECKQNSCKKCKSIRIVIPVKCGTYVSHSRAGSKMGGECEVPDFTISASYGRHMTISRLFIYILREIDRMCYPKSYWIKLINESSFIGKTLYPGFKNDIWSTPIIYYSVEDIIDKGFDIIPYIEYRHIINDNIITCRYIQHIEFDEDEKTDGNLIALKCPIYKAMKIDYEFTENNLKHLIEYAHFTDKYNEKLSCKYYLNCQAFIRLENGGNRLDDKCHVQIYKHPPRNSRQIKMSENIHSFIVNTKKEQNHPVYAPNAEDEKQYHNSNDGYIQALIQEVISNGYRYDLCLECAKSDDCKHDTYSLLSIVDEKLKHIRHAQMDNPLNKGEILAFVLYTGCDCNYDLCSSQRNRDYEKWKWFDYCLYKGIYKLSCLEKASYKLYTGLDKVKLNTKDLSLGYFPTYTSTSWIKSVSMTFIGDEGMIIEMDEKMREWFICCDVSWISKFPDECEILISRTVEGWNNFKLSVTDEQNRIQTASLALSWQYQNQ
eukprot:50785_1